MTARTAGTHVSTGLFRRAAGQDPQRGHRQEKGGLSALGVRADGTKEILGIWI